MSKHILVVSQYYYPENFRINDITKEWIKRGYKVTVITGIPNYPSGRFFKGYGFFRKRREIVEGVNIIRIAIIPRFQNPILLAINYLSFVLSGWIWAKFTRLEADIVFNFEVSPMTQALPAIWFAKRKKIPCYLYVTDLWPQSVVFATGLKNKYIINRIQRMVDKIYQRCTNILISSRGFYEPIGSRGINKQKIIYWPQFPEDVYKPHQPHGKKILLPNDELFNLTFTGNIGYAQGLSVLVETAKILKDSNIHIRINIIGNGRYMSDFLTLINKYNVNDYFNFIGQKPSYEIPIYLSESDAAFISLEKEKVFEFTLPSKIQTYLACGIPIIGSASGELKKLIEESNCGYCSEANNPVELASNINQMLNLSKDDLNRLASNGYRYCKENFDKEVLLKQFDEIIKC